MCWGLEVGDGWFDLIDALCASLSSTYSTTISLSPEETELYGERYGTWNRESGKHEGPDVAHSYMEVSPPAVVADQVKEKFGTLRFYYHLIFDPKLLELAERNVQAQQTIDRYVAYFDGIIHHAETYSARTCEVTGKPGELGSCGGWVSVRCPEQAALENRNWKSYRQMEASKCEHAG